MTVRYSAQSDGGEGLTNQITKTVPILILWWNLLIIYIFKSKYHCQKFILLFWDQSPANALYCIFLYFLNFDNTIK